MRSAPHRRLSLAISWIKATVSWEILGVREVALDLYFQKSLKPWRCQREPRLWLDNKQCLLPGANDPGQKHEEDAVRLGTSRPFHLPTQDDQRLSQQGIFCDQLRLATGLVCQHPKPGERWCPV